ncbi:hypothetical protein M8J75_010908 [Diaphorina citri]|nr:hypothetical protein M8J75_010908 [Diaphorina citri]
MAATDRQSTLPPHILLTKGLTNANFINAISVNRWIPRLNNTSWLENIGDFIRSSRGFILSSFDMGDLIDQGGSDVSSGDIDNDDDSLSSLHGSDVATPGTLNYDENDLKYCWVCFATHEDDRNALWVQPCLCRGTSKWVHQACLNRWIDEKQKGNAFTQVACPQCLLVSLLDTIDTAVYKLCPFVAAGVVLGSMYWCAVTYGAVTVMVVIGRENGLQVMREVDAIVLLLGLPAIPVVLILANMVTWEDRVLTLLRRHVSESDPSMVDSSGGSGVTAGSLPPLTSTVSATRVLCSALVLPSLATLCGRYLFPSMRSSLQRTLVGGVTFIVIKGILKIYHKQQKFVMQRRRRVLDFADRPPSTSRTS